MYIIAVILLTLVLPVGSSLVEASWPGHPHFAFLAASWFVFWAVGARLLLAGARQVLQPAFTAEVIFELKEPGSFELIRELGCFNLALGILGILTVFRPGWVIPAAVAGALFYGFAGINHAMSGKKGRNRKVAMVSDFFVFAVLAVCLARIWMRHR